MRFYNGQHQYYCGIDLHVKTMYLCIPDGTGQVLVHWNPSPIDPGGFPGPVSIGNSEPERTASWLIDADGASAASVYRK